MIQSVSIVGLGKLGASMAAAVAGKGFHVIGVDVNQKAVDAINSGRAPVYETHLEDMVRDNRDRLKATMSHREGILDSDITFVIVPTPSDDAGSFSLQYAAWAFGEIGNALGEKDGYHLLVMTSTVLPGSVRYGLLPILERRSGKTCGQDFGLCYSPEFIALGNVIHEFLNPDFTLVGEFDERSGTELERFYARVMENHAPCKRMSLENAELAKIALNSYITTKITFANLLADLCERIPGGDVDLVTDALGTDRRIGHAYLKGATGYGGPCFPRDNVALGYIARRLDTRFELGESTDRINRGWPDKIIARLGSYIKNGATVAVLGLAYKPYSHIVEESQGIFLAKALSRSGVRVVAYDPLGNDMARAELRDHVVVLDSVGDCLKQSDVVLITTPDPVFRKLSVGDFQQGKPMVTVIDFWRILDKTLAGQEGIRYVPAGRSLDDDANASRLEKLWHTASIGNAETDQEE